PMRWLLPPPARTAYFCASRRPGRVLRVSRIRAPVPRTASTNAAVVVAVPLRVWRKLSAVRSALTRARARPCRVARTVPACTRVPSATRQSMRTPGSRARWQALYHGRPQTTASSWHSSQALPGPSGRSAAVTSLLPRSSASARATSASMTSRGGGARASMTSGLREVLQLVGGDGLVRQQYRDPVLDPVNALAVPRHQRLAQRPGLGGAVGAVHAAGGDGRVECFQSALFKHRQRQAGDRAYEDVEQLAIHGNAS